MIDWLNDRAVSEFINAMAWTHLHFLWQGCVLAGIFAVLVHTMRRSNPQASYILGCAALAIMAVAPVVTFGLLWNNAAAPVSAPAASAQLLLTAQAASPPGISTPLLVVAGVWCLGAVISATWLAGGWIDSLTLRRSRTLALPKRTQALLGQLAAAMHVRAAVRLVDTARVKVPMTLGWLSPVILLPAGMLAGLSTNQLRAIIAHELAHVRRWDYLVNLLQRVLEAMLFYHPAVWWVSSRVRQEREYCCDDVAAAVCGDRVLYAQALAELETIRAAGFQLALSSQGGSLMNRITRLLGVSAPRPSRTRRPLAGAAALAALTAASAAFALAHRPQHADDCLAAHEKTAQTGAVMHKLLVKCNPGDNATLQMTVEECDAKGSLYVLRPKISMACEGELALVEKVLFETHTSRIEAGELTLTELQPPDMIAIHLAVETASPDPIDRLIEAERLHYPWDIFDIVLGPDPGSALPAKVLSHDLATVAVRYALVHEVLLQRTEAQDLAVELIEEPAEALQFNEAGEPHVQLLRHLPTIASLRLVNTLNTEAARGNADVIIEEVVELMLEEEPE